MELTAVRGMLFEEAVLFLLQRAGYTPVTDIGSDPTLSSHSGGMGIAVIGRGAKHQIDAIADYTIGLPFSHPQRLLVEAKCFTNGKTVGLETIRNAVGVLKDVSEFWNTFEGLPKDYRRYHYQKALFTATTFTAQAEQYAFAHDIYLFPMAKSACFINVLKAIFGIRTQSLKKQWLMNQPQPLSTLRREIRQRLNVVARTDHAHHLDTEDGEEWARYAREVTSLRGVVVALIARSFPLFLVPSTHVDIERLPNELNVRVRFQSTKGWTLTDADDRVLFSFDLPPLLFAMYAGTGGLTRLMAAQMKAEMFSDLQAVVFRNNLPRMINFRLDGDWFTRLRAYAETAAQELVQEH